MAQIPASMTAIEISAPGGPDVLRPCTLETPRPGHGEVLIEIAAAGVNRPDCMQREGGYPPPPGAPETPGLEVAGTIVACGAGIDRWAVGDPVCALLAGGGYAEYCLAPAAQVLPKPAALDWVEAAALPETFFTVWDNVFRLGRLRGGERLLVHGGASGIGTTAIQLGAAFGARVFATAGSAEKCRACERLGAERGINYRDEDFVAVCQELSDGAGVDVVLDMVAGPYIPRNLEVLGFEGRLVLIAFLQGPRVERANFLPVLMKHLTITGSRLRPRGIEEKARIAAALEAEVWPLLEQGRVKPVIDARFALADAASAHARMESGAHIGKVMLTV